MFKSWKFKILFPLFLLTTLFVTFSVLWHFPVSEGKRVGNLTKFSHKGKFSFTKTWEGIIDEGYGDKLTSYFSVRSEQVASELYAFEGKEVTIFYKEYLVGWPWETKYDVYDWKPVEQSAKNAMTTAHEVVPGQYHSVGAYQSDDLLEAFGRTLFCSLLGSLYHDQDLYEKVRIHLQKNNLFLFKQIKKCNE